MGGASHVFRARRTELFGSRVVLLSILVSARLFGRRDLISPPLLLNVRLNEVIHRPATWLDAISAVHLASYFFPVHRCIA